MAFLTTFHEKTSAKKYNEGAKSIAAQLESSHNDQKSIVLEHIEEFGRTKRYIDRKLNDTFYR